MMIWLETTASILWLAWIVSLEIKGHQGSIKFNKLEKKILRILEILGSAVVVVSVMCLIYILSSRGFAGLNDIKYRS